MALLLAMGAARLVFKPAMTLLQAAVAQTETQEDDRILSRVTGSRWFQILAWAVDFLGSVKLPVVGQAVRQLPNSPNTMKSILLVMTLGLALLALGCAGTSTVQRDRSFDPVTGAMVRDVETRFGNRNVFQADSSLNQFRSAATDDGLSVDLGALSARADGNTLISPLTQIGVLALQAYLGGMGSGVPPSPPPQMSTTNRVLVPPPPAVTITNR